MPVATSRLAVPFTGSTDLLTGPLTWGQVEIWQTMRRTGRTLNIGGVVALGPDATVPDLAATLGRLVSRHQALRTRLRLCDDELPQQVVHASGTVDLEVVASSAGDAELAAEAVRTRYEFTPFDLETEFPVRWGVVTVDGVPSHLVVQYSHLAVDGFGIEALVRDLPHLNTAADPAADPVGAGRRGAPAGTRPPPGAARRTPAQREVAAALGGGAAGPAGGPVRHVRRPAARPASGSSSATRRRCTSPCRSSPRGPGWRPATCCSPPTGSRWPGSPAARRASRRSS